MRRSRIRLAITILCLTLVGVLLAVPAFGQTGMRLATGSYTGNGLDNRAITGLGFSPDFVMVKVRDFGQRLISKSSTMGADIAKPLAGTNAVVDYIRSLDGDGFTLRTDTTVNLSGRVYDWVAFKAAPGQMAVGSYVGNGVAGRSISVGFQPTILFLMAQATSRPALQRTSTMAATHARQFDGTIVTGAITALTSTGFTVSTDNQSNENGTTFHWVAWADTPTVAATGSYTGSGVDDRNISGVGFQPQLMIVARNGTTEATWRPGHVAGDVSLLFSASAAENNDIQAILADGFQIGTRASVNATGGQQPYHWMAFAGSTAAAPVNTVVPTVSGTTQVGQTLTATSGTWTGVPTPTLTYQWRRCDAGGANCADIASATATTYVLVPADLGATIRVVVTGTNASGSASGTSAATGVVAPAPAAPVNTAVPIVSGTAEVGQTLTATSGTWTGVPTPTLTYQWRRCDAGGANCADIASATATTYVLVPADLGATIRVVVTGTNASGSATGTSTATAAVAPAPAAPVNTAVPTVSGTTDVGQTLTATSGTWTGVPTPTLTYQWRRCDAAGANCADIASATATTYVLVPADLAATIRVVVTGTNISGSATGTSAATAAVAPAPAAPVNTAAPTVSGTPEVGQTLSATSGTWTGVPTPTLTYQWRRCDAAGANCADIASATATTYVLVPADLAATIRVVVTGTNASGSATGTSAATGVVAPAPAAPVNTAVPTVSGTTDVGQTLTATSGTWTGVPTPTLTYQWRRCDAGGANCADIASATATTYALVPVDLAATIRVVVTGTNASGSATGTSAATGVVAPAPAAPVNTAVPTVSGAPDVGQTLTATSGTWTGVPTPTLTYQWRRCDAGGANCADIASATATTYALVPADLAATIRVVVTGTNASGSATGTSAATGVVAPAPAAPVNTAVPTVSGATDVGQTLTATSGTWTGVPTPTLTYQWRRCDAGGANCADIASATATTYVLVSADLAATIRVVVTGTNASGSATGTSAATGVVAPAPAAPVNTAAPTVSGTPEVGQTLTATSGTWTGVPTPTLTYQWRRCDAAGANCADIASATATTYALVLADLAATIRVVVTGTNAPGSATGTSAATAAVASAPPAPAAPVNTAAPAVSGTAEVGHTLTATSGTWTGVPTPTLTYQWRRCDAAGANCVDIASATATTYVLTAADLGSTIRMAVTATNSSGASTALSVATVVLPIATPPVNVALPGVVGRVAEGTLMVGTGTWTGSPAPTIALQWMRCDAAGDNCNGVEGATKSTYVLSRADRGATIRIQVTATNTFGSAIVTSGPSEVVAAFPNLNVLLNTVGELVRSQPAAQFEVRVSNDGTSATLAPVTVTVAPGAGVRAIQAAGSGWICNVLPQVTCGRSDVLSADSAFPVIVVTTSIASDAPDSVATTAIAASGADSVEAHLVSPVHATSSLKLTIAVPNAKRAVSRGAPTVLVLEGRNDGLGALFALKTGVLLPSGFHYVTGTARLSVAAEASGDPMSGVTGGAAMAPDGGRTVTNGGPADVAIEPETGPDGSLVFGIGQVRPGETVRLSLQVTLNAGARTGDNVAHIEWRAPLVNGAYAVTDTLHLDVQESALRLPQVLLGRVFEDLDGDGAYDAGEPGVRGVRIVTATGLSATTDANGLYSIPSLAPGGMALAVDPATLPAGLVLSTRAQAIRTPLEGGGLLRQNFALVRSTSGRSLLSPVIPPVRAAVAQEESTAPAVRIDVTVERASMAADGRDVQQISLRAVDIDGRPTASTSIAVRTNAGMLFALTGAGEQTCAARMYADDRPELSREVVVVTKAGHADVCFVSDIEIGRAHISAWDAIAPATTGSADVQFEVTHRAPVFVALGELGISIMPPAGQTSDAQRVDGQATMFFSGSLGRADLLTIALRTRDAINAASGSSGLFAADPTLRDYRLLGDASSQQELAQSNSRFYLRYDWSRTSIVAGDLRGDVTTGNLPRPGDLMEFGRHLTGVRFTTTGRDAHDWMQAQAARPRTGFAREVLTAVQGTTILLAQAPIVRGSETVVLDVRDRRSPDQVVSRRSLTRNVDYNLNPDTGVLYLLQPLPLFDSTLNVVHLIASYEYEHSGFESMVYLARGSRRFDALGLQLGGSVLVEHDDRHNLAVGGLEVEQRLFGAGRLTLQAPLSRVRTDVTSVPPASDEVATPVNTGVTAAVQLDAEQPFGGQTGLARFHLSKTPAEFANPYGEITVPGNQLAAGSVETRVFRSVRFRVSADHEQNRTSRVDNQRVTLGAHVSFAAGKARFDAGVDGRRLDDHQAGTRIDSRLLSAGVEWQPVTRFVASVRREQNLVDADPTYPNQTVLGARFRLSSGGVLFFTQRLSAAPIVPISDASARGLFIPASTKETSIGVESRLQSHTSLTSRYQITDGISGADSYAVVGVVTRLPVRKDLAFDWGLDRAQHLTGSSVSYTSGAVSVSYTPAEALRASLRYELRRGDQFQHTLAAAFVGRVSRDVTVLARYRLADTLSNGASVRFADGELSAAIRPKASDRGALLVGYTFNRRADGHVASAEARASSDRLSLDGLLELPARLELFGRASYVRRLDPIAATWIAGSLYQLRLQRTVIGRFDAAVEARRVTESAVDPGRTIYAVEWGTRLGSDLRVGVGYGSSPFAVDGSVLRSTASSGGVYLVMTSTLSRLFELLPVSR